jgi:hypothetical protein
MLARHRKRLNLAQSDLGGNLSNWAELHLRSIRNKIVYCFESGPVGNEGEINACELREYAAHEVGWGTGDCGVVKSAGIRFRARYEFRNGLCA